MGFSGGSVVNILSIMQEIWVQSMDWEDLLEKKIFHSNMLPFPGNPIDKEAWGYSPWAHKIAGHGLTAKQQQQSVQQSQTIFWFSKLYSSCNRR